VAVEVHHRDGVENWPALFAAVRNYLLCSPEKMETLCKACHKKAEKGDDNTPVSA